MAHCPLDKDISNSLFSFMWAKVPLGGDVGPLIIFEIDYI